jgi:hypothetical protein
VKKPKPTASSKAPITEAELLKGLRAMLGTIEPVERPLGLTGKGRTSPLQTVPVTIRIPKDLDAELRGLGRRRPKSWHIERAIMLYLKVMEAEGVSHD